MKLPAGITLVKDFGDTSMFKVHCDCGSDHHTHDLFIDYDAGMNITSVQIHVLTKTNWTKRWSVLWRVLTKGYVEQDVEMILTPEQAENYAKLLRGEIR